MRWYSDSTEVKIVTIACIFHYKRSESTWLGFHIGQKERDQETIPTYMDYRQCYITFYTSAALSAIDLSESTIKSFKSTLDKRQLRENFRDAGGVYPLLRFPPKLKFLCPPHPQV